MKLTLVLATALTFAGYATATYSVDLTTLYSMVCAPNDQMSLHTDGTAATSLYADNSFFQLVTGYALGTQVEQNVTDSTCFQQAW